MTGIKLLLDTNIFIALEDPKVVPPAVAALSQKVQQHGIAVFLHEASFEDVNRDRDTERRNIIRSKLAKFRILERVAHRSERVLADRFGPVKSTNDRTDVLMLDALELGVVDFLVTEDIGIHKRAQRAGLRDRVFTVREALAWIQRTYDPREFPLPFIVSRQAHQIPLDDPIFGSLREDYEGFDAWFAKCRKQHRECWVVEISGQLAGIVIRKDEDHTEADTHYHGNRILKVCTFKMKPEYQGEKFGEQLLKQILWFAQANGYDLVYLTVFPKHELLISLLKTFGFEITKERANGELVIEKRIIHDKSVTLTEKESPLTLDLRVYPRFYDGPLVGKYIVPIQPRFHAVLFPEIDEATPLPLFKDEQFLLSTVSATSRRDRTPGNTIRKVYICRSPTRNLSAGDIVLFYLSKSRHHLRSQSVTTLGVVEQVQLASSANQLIRLVGRRSVFSHEDLHEMHPSEESPILVIDFLLNGHFEPHVPISELRSAGVLTERPPQSIKRVSESAYQALRAATRLAFES